MLFYLLVFCGKEQEAEYCVSSLVWVVYIGIYKICCNIYTKICLLTENVPIDKKMCLLNENMLINQKGAYWKMKRHNCLVFLNVHVT